MTEEQENILLKPKFQTKDKKLKAELIKQTHLLK